MYKASVGEIVFFIDNMEIKKGKRISWHLNIYLRWEQKINRNYISSGNKNYILERQDTFRTLANAERTLKNRKEKHVLLTNNRR